MQAEGDESVSSSEIFDECFVLEICIDRYLWMLYQRTPKLDTIKVVDEQKVTVTKDGKTRDHHQKDYQASERGFYVDGPPRRQKKRPYRDYLIGGINLSFTEAPVSTAA